MEEESQSKYEWFIEPLDDEANGRIGNLLASMQMAEDVAIGLMVEKNGRFFRINAFRAPHKLIQFIESSREHLKLKFRVWNRRSRNERLREWKFGRKKKKVRKIKEKGE